MFYEILSTDRQAVLPRFKNLKNQFYLAGGTALALQIGHRDSADFDFFNPASFNTNHLLDQLRQIFDNNIVINQNETDTLTVVADKIKISFFSYPYILLEHPLDTENLKIATILDIGCMKLNTILGRATTKDYVDLYFILQRIPLDSLLEATKRKYPSLDAMTVLKGLSYFEDIETAPLIYKITNPPSFEQVKKFLTDETKKYFSV